MSYMRTCRFCGEHAWASELVKYGTRAYAHPNCYMAHKTMKDAAVLPLYEKRKLEAALWDAAIAKAEGTS